MSGQSVEVAIVGGGAIGTSVLFHLAERHGVTDAVLFEKDQLGSGSTSKAAGGIRNTFTGEANIELGNRNIEFFEAFEENVGTELEFRQNGYMYLYHTEEAEQTWRERESFFNAHGANAELLTAAEATEVFPHLDPAEFRGALFAPDCGHVDPHRLTQAFGKAATDRGATIETKTSVTDVTVTDGSVSSVQTDAGRYEVDKLLNAGGPWASRLGGMVGVDIPIELMIRRIMVTSPVSDGGSPLVIDPEMECYFSAEQNGSLLVCDMEQDIHDVTDPDTAVSNEIGYEYYLSTSEKVSTLVPEILELDVINGWGGLQSHSPDGHAIIGGTDVEDFFVACGFSGHGVQQSPTVGAALADLLVEGETDVLREDHFSLDRFESDHRVDPERMA
jgi:sarcosine oxidase subunit beta